MAKVGGEWTEDEGAADKERPSQFERGNAFQLRIVVGKDNYVISVGGADGAGASYRAKFSHKIPLDDVVRAMHRFVILAILALTIVVQCDRIDGFVLANDCEPQGEVEKGGAVRECGTVSSREEDEGAVPDVGAREDKLPLLKTAGHQQ